MQTIIAVIGVFMRSVIGGFVLRFIAIKTLVVTLMIVTLPIILKNLVVWFFETVSGFITSNLPDHEFTGSVIQLTGAAAYLAEQLRLADCMAVFVTALMVRSVIMFIPFVR